MKESGIIEPLVPAAERYGADGQTPVSCALTRRETFAHVDAAGQPRAQTGHHLAHVARAGGRSLGDGLGHRGGKFLRRQAGGEIGAQQPQLEGLGIDQIVAPRLRKLRDRIPTLFEHPVDDGDDRCVIERDALVDLPLLDCRRQQTQGAKRLCRARAHGCLDVFVDAFFEGHRETPS
jgi:hypothetical protein